MSPPRQGTDHDLRHPSWNSHPSLRSRAYDSGAPISDISSSQSNDLCRRYQGMVASSGRRHWTNGPRRYCKHNGRLKVPRLWSKRRLGRGTRGSSWCGRRLALSQTACPRCSAFTSIVKVDGASETGLWLASRHITHRSGKRRIEVETIGQPVSVSGVSIAPGDLMVGDETGIVVIPKRHWKRPSPRPAE